MRLMKSFMGYARSDGTAGARNHVAILPTVACANGVAMALARRVPGTVPMPHAHGCGRAGRDLELHYRAIENLAAHPNIGALLLVGLGCELIRTEFIAESAAASGRPVARIDIQSEGGSRHAVAKGVEILKDLVAVTDGAERVETSLDRLTVGLKCGGSDAFSGVTANPAVGLVADTGGLDAHWQPTTAYDGWRAAAPEHRWLVLARSWLTMSRLPGLVGRRDDRDKVIAALGPDVERSLAPEIRRTALGALAKVPAGSAPEPASLGALLSWRAPRRGGRLRDLAVEWTLAEAAALGVTGRGALSAAGRALLADDEAAAAAALAAVLPPPLDHVLLQADLTAVAPGPLEPDLARELALVADVESSGGATVFRISAASVRRALDAGRSASELHELFKSRSRTPVPQALTYLVDDVARRHGVLRVGTATAYVRCDDDALLAEVLVARKAAPLRLRRLAPTVLTAHASVENVLDVLREAGYAPVAESPDGAVVIKRTTAHRTAVRPRPPRLAGDAPMPTAAQVANSVRGLRAGDEAARAARRAPVTTSGAVYSPHSRGSDALAVLQHAALDRRPVWLRYVNAQGQASHRIVEPTSVNGGYLTAYDHRREDTLTFALHRVTGVSELLGDEAP